MKRPTIAVCLTIHDRPEEVMRKVFDSLLPQAFDQLVVTLDRPSREVSDFVRNYLYTDDRTEIFELAGKPGWLCPARAWNEGFARVRTELVYCISSETVQREGNVRVAVDALQDRPAILFGKAECSCGPLVGEVNWMDGTPHNLFCDSKHPRPLGFIWAGPMWVVRATGGYDEALMRGHWFDDNCFFWRVWNLGVPFIFTDDIYGLHIHHERPELSEESIQRNLDYIVEKYGSLSAIQIEPRRVEREPGVTKWLK